MARAYLKHESKAVMAPEVEKSTTQFAGAREE
jgi:hypothetical protein